MGGVSFDRAAEYYDATRRVPGEVEAAVADLLLSELADTELCLEIGVGTGRIARPLAERGVPLLGVDLAPAMLRRLVDNAGGTIPFPVVAADITALPLDADSVDAVLGCHVLHLVSDWKIVVDEACRVLRPGGRMFVDFGGPAPTPWADDCEKILQGHGVSRTRPGVSGPGPVADYLGERVGMRRLRTVEFTVETSLAADLEKWESQILAWTWSYTAEQMKQACDEIRARSASLRWVVDERVRLRDVVQWWAFHLVV